MRLASAVAGGGGGEEWGNAVVFNGNHAWGKYLHLAHAMRALLRYITSTCLKHSILFLVEAQLTVPRGPVMGKSWYDFSPDNLCLESLLVCTHNQNTNYIRQQEHIVSLYCDFDHLCSAVSCKSIILRGTISWRIIFSLIIWPKRMTCTMKIYLNSQNSKHLIFITASYETKDWNALHKELLIYTMFTLCWL